MHCALGRPFWGRFTVSGFLPVGGISPRIVSFERSLRNTLRYSTQWKVKAYVLAFKYKHKSAMHVLLIFRSKRDSSLGVKSIWIIIIMNYVLILSNKFKLSSNSEQVFVCWFPNTDKQVENTCFSNSSIFWEKIEIILILILWSIYEGTWLRRITILFSVSFAFPFPFPRKKRRQHQVYTKNISFMYLFYYVWDKEFWLFPSLLH